MSAPPGWQRGHPNVFWLLWWAPYGPHGRAPYRTAISEPSIKSCFCCSEERGRREGEGNALEGAYSKAVRQKDFLLNMSENQLSHLDYLGRADCIVVLSHSIYRLLDDTKHKEQSILFDVGVGSSRQHKESRWKMWYIKCFITSKSIFHFCYKRFNIFCRTYTTYWDTVDAPNRLPFSCKQAFIFLNNGPSLLLAACATQSIVLLSRVPKII